MMLQLLPLRPMLLLLLLLRLHGRDRRQLPARGDTPSGDASAASIVVVVARRPRDGTSSDPSKLGGGTCILR
jgi:hypothetical protein